MTPLRLRRGRPGPRSAVSDDAILDAAVQVLVADAEASVEAIARRARVDVRDLRARFGSRDRLIELAVMRGARRLARGAFLEDGTPAEQIALLVARLWEDQEPVARVVTLGVRAQLREPVEDALRPLRDLLADAVARGAADGDLRGDVSPRAIAWLIEQAMLDCLEAHARGLMEGEDGRAFAMQQALATAGLGWRDAAAVTARVTTRIA